MNGSTRNGYTARDIQDSDHQPPPREGQPRAQHPPTRVTHRQAPIAQHHATTHANQHQPPAPRRQSRRQRPAHTQRNRQRANAAPRRAAAQREPLLKPQRPRHIPRSHPPIAVTHAIPHRHQPRRSRSDLTKRPYPTPQATTTPTHPPRGHAPNHAQTRRRPHRHQASSPQPSAPHGKRPDQRPTYGRSPPTSRQAAAKRPHPTQHAFPHATQPALRRTHRRPIATTSQHRRHQHDRHPHPGPTANRPRRPTAAGNWRPQRQRHAPHAQKAFPLPGTLSCSSNGQPPTKVVLNRPSWLRRPLVVLAEVSPNDATTFAPPGEYSALRSLAMVFQGSGLSAKRDARRRFDGVSGASLAVGCRCCSR